MNVGDLVRYAPLWAHHRARTLGVVAKVGEFCPQYSPDNVMGKVTVIWVTGEQSVEPTNALQVLEEPLFQTRRC